jgi:PadR family transcriptional regulator PadR
VGGLAVDAGVGVDGGALDQAQKARAAATSSSTSSINMPDPPVGRLGGFWIIWVPIRAVRADVAEPRSCGRVAAARKFYSLQCMVSEHNMPLMDLSSWQTQLRKGAAELVVLSILKRGERYGLDILDQAGGSGGVLSDGTLYPLLTRLEREGKLQARWAMAEDAKVPRKYYDLTEEGRILVSEMERAWAEFSAFVSGAIEESRDERPAAAPGPSLSAQAR